MGEMTHMMWNEPFYIYGLVVSDRLSIDMGYIFNFQLIGIDRIRVNILPSHVGAASCMV